MSLYQKKLEELIGKKREEDAAFDAVGYLFRLGVIDNTLTKVLVIREYVEEQMKAGASKLNAMWQATEIFACSYEYVRKCVYYYKDIGGERLTFKNV